MNAFIVAYYEIRRMLRVKTTVLILLLMPLVLIFILGSALSGLFSQQDEEIKPVTIAVNNPGTGAISSTFQSFLLSDEIGKYVKVVKTDSREAVEKSVRSGEADYGLNVPDSFDDQVTAGKAAEWEMIPGKDRESNLKAQHILQAFLDRVNAMQSMVVALGKDAKLANPEQVDSNAGDVVKIGRLSRTDSNFTSQQYFAAQMLIMFMLYAGLSAATSMVIEKETHTLSRLSSTPINQSHIMLGKVLGNGAISAAQAAIIILFTHWIYGIDWGHDPIKLGLICLSTIVTSMGLASIVSLFFRNSKSAGMIFQVVTITMTMLSGGFSGPNMGETLETLGKFTSSYWAARGILQIMLDTGSQVVNHHLSILAAISGSILLIAFVLYRKVGYHE